MANLNRYQMALGIVALGVAAASFQAPGAEASSWCGSSWNSSEMCPDGTFRDTCYGTGPEYCCESSC